VQAQRVAAPGERWGYGEHDVEPVGPRIAATRPATSASMARKHRRARASSAAQSSGIPITLPGRASLAAPATKSLNPANP